MNPITSIAFGYFSTQHMHVHILWKLRQFSGKGLSASQHNLSHPAKLAALAHVVRTVEYHCTMVHTDHAQQSKLSMSPQRASKLD